MEEEISRHKQERLAKARQKPMHEAIVDGRKYTVLLEVFSPSPITEHVAKTMGFPEQRRRRSDWQEQPKDIREGLHVVYGRLRQRVREYPDVLVRGLV